MHTSNCKMITLSEDVNCNWMARHNTPTILTEEDRVVVSRKLGNQHFRLLSWNISSFNKAYGFLGAYFNVTAMVSVEDSANVEGLKFFAKTPPPPESSLGIFLERCDGFNKEINVYDELIPPAFILYTEYLGSSERSLRGPYSSSRIVV
ncbi:uncharacterized protein LOC111674106 isoform X1 [Orussus abietinus]|uniref:uncharacterized protein LOC111674106 isoform X1 n=1 Tax=Orussus abietinus TaxID=222816 RepID=UPI000C715C86|nr:uncharacterized protein LOC111674106 isoform X1 [Orussus abietinus]